MVVVALKEEKSDSDYDFLSADDRLKAGVLTVSEHSSLLAREQKYHDEDQLRFEAQVSLLKGFLFKADKPYRCTLGVHNNISSSGAGLLNSQFNVNSVTTVNEWSTLIALFDEVFVHSMIIRFYPVNITGVGPATGSANPTIVALSSVITTQGIQNCGAIIAAYFNKVSSVTAASAMSANPNHKLVHTAKSWQYAWRNNVKFDPRGPALNLTSADLGWQGWAFVANANELGGFIALRGINDPTLPVSAVLGTFELLYDVSFRARI